jgi:hypothetical protein
MIFFKLEKTDNEILKSRNFSRPPSNEPFNFIQQKTLKLERYFVAGIKSNTVEAA